jgi:hypothetical protein
VPRPPLDGLIDDLYYLERRLCATAGLGLVRRFLREHPGHAMDG